MTKPKDKVTAVVLKHGKYKSLNEWRTLSSIQPGLDAPLSKQLDEEKFNYGMDNVYVPPFDPNYLASCLLQSTVHARCVSTKAADVAGGWSVQEQEGIDDADPENKAVLENFFRNCGESEHTLISIMKAVNTDLESIGWSGLEIGRNALGVPTRLWHVPGTSLRVRRGKNRCFIQRSGSEKRYFQAFPQKCELEKNASGNVVVKKWALMNPLSGQLIEAGNPLEAANELIFFSIYHPLSPVYGCPDFITALGAILGNIYARDYNLDYFTDNMIPPYAVIVSGAQVGKEVQEIVEKYFEDIRGSNSSTLVLGIPGKDTKVSFERLESMVKDQAFTEYLKNNRDELLLAHGVHPARVGIIETASLGAGTGTSQLEHYKTSVVEPKQRRDEAMLNDILIRHGFMITDHRFAYSDLDIRDRDQESQILTRYVGKDRPVLTQNEARKVIGYPDLTPDQVAELKASAPTPANAVSSTAEATKAYEVQEVRKSSKLPFFKQKVKGNPAFGVAMDSRQAFTESLKQIWGNVDLGDLRTNLTDSNVNAFVAAMTAAINKAASQELVKTRDTVAPFVAKHLGADLSPETMDDVMDEIQGKFSDYVKTGWLADTRTKLLEVGSLAPAERELQLESTILSMASRSAMYGAMGWALYNGIVKATAHQEEKSIYWITTGSPCADCAALAASNPHSPLSLSQLPGDGATQCRGNCKCFLDIRNVSG